MLAKWTARDGVHLEWRCTLPSKSQLFPKAEISRPGVAEEGCLAYKTFPFTDDSPDFSAEAVILRRIGFFHYLLPGLP